MRLMFFALPRSGSSWLGRDVLGKRFHYFEEYFNHAGCPICKPNPNHKYRCIYREQQHEKIRDLFGSTVYWQGLGSTSTDAHRRCIDETWCQQKEYEIDKEVFSFSKLDAYSGFYDASFTFYRNRRMTFPAGSDAEKTHRCYESIWKSLNYNSCKYGPVVQRMIVDVRPVTGEERLYAAHAIASYLLIKNSLELGLPIVRYHRVERDLKLVSPLFDIPALGDSIIESFQVHPKNGYPHAESLYEKLAQFMEPEVRDVIMDDQRYFI